VRDVAQILSLQTFLTTKLLGIETILYSQHPLEKKLKLHIRFFQILKLVPKKHITPVRNNPHQVYNKQSNSYYVPLFTPFTPNIHNRKARCSKKINIIFVGKFSLIRKNHLLMLRAFKNILQSCEAHLTMVGTVNTENPQKIYNDVNDYIISNNLSNNVDIKTNLPYEEMVEEYRKNDILALPSINEPFSITPIEAMSFGLPVIVSESNGTKGCIINGENGFIIADNNQAELEKSLLFFTKKKELGSFREKAYSYIKSQHSSKKFYNHFISAIQKIKYDS
jgi:glycosyltransferase involved in cell wall biosynthesis